MVFGALFGQRYLSNGRGVSQMFRANYSLRQPVSEELKIWRERSTFSGPRAPKIGSFTLKIFVEPKNVWKCFTTNSVFSAFLDEINLLRHQIFWVKFWPTLDFVSGSYFRMWFLVPCLGSDISATEVVAAMCLEPAIDRVNLCRKNWKSCEIDRPFRGLKIFVAPKNVTTISVLSAFLDEINNLRHKIFWVTFFTLLSHLELGPWLRLQLNDLVLVWVVISRRRKWWQPNVYSQLCPASAGVGRTQNVACAADPFCDPDNQYREKMSSVRKWCCQIYCFLGVCWRDKHSETPNILSKSFTHTTHVGLWLWLRLCNLDIVKVEFFNVLWDAIGSDVSSDRRPRLGRPPQHQPCLLAMLPFCSGDCTVGVFCCCSWIATVWLTNCCIWLNWAVLLNLCCVLCSDRLVLCGASL